MTIQVQAVYLDGVLRPKQPVALPNGTEVQIAIETLDTGIANGPAEGGAAVLLAKLAAIAAQHPENPNLPTDFAEQHDHYLYGTPKRP